MMGFSFATQHRVAQYGTCPRLPADGSATAQDLITRTDTGAALDGYPEDAGVRTATTEYNWSIGKPTKSIADPAGLALTRTLTYDTTGRVTDTALLTSSGTDAGAVHTTFCTATGTAPCGSRSEWADLTCPAAPKGPVSGGGSNPGELITKTTTYTYAGGVDTVTEAANGITRTTTATYDGAARPIKVGITGATGTASRTLPADPVHHGDSHPTTTYLGHHVG